MKEKDTSIRELFHQPPTETLTDVSVSGWVRTVRDSKAFGFIELNDGTYFILVSETRRPATIYTSKSLDGPWVKRGAISFEKNGFNIDVHELVRFVQPNQLSVILNRVVGTDPSNILGQMQANGRVFLINPNGVVFGPNAACRAAGRSDRAAQCVAAKAREVQAVFICWRASEVGP